MRGHLRRRGDAWELRAYAGRDPVTGRRVYKTRTFRGRRRDAEDALARLVREVAGGGHAARDATVGALVGQWFGLAKADLSPSTVRGYERSIRRYILPKLGEIPLDQLRVARLDQHYAELRARGGDKGAPLAPATVRQVHAVLRRALQQAVKWGWIESNPAALASPPRVRSRPLQPPDPETVVSLIEAARKRSPDLGVFFHLAAVTGARRGELCGLHWEAVDFERSAMTIARSIVNGDRGALIEKDTKTHSIRRIALDPTTMEALGEHLRRAIDRAHEFGARIVPTAYVFSKVPDATAPWPPNAVTHEFIRLRGQLGLKDVRLHDLRHFAATRLLGAGIPVRTVSGRLGHSNAATTLGVYAHFLEASDRDAASALEDLLSRSTPSPSAEGPPPSQRRPAPGARRTGRRSRGRRS